MKKINTYIQEKLIVNNTIQNNTINDIYKIVIDSKDSDIPVNPFKLKVARNIYTITRIIKDIDFKSKIYTLMDENGYMACYMTQSAFDRIFKDLTHGAVYVENRLQMAKIVK